MKLFAILVALALVLGVLAIVGGFTSAMSGGLRPVLQERPYRLEVPAGALNLGAGQDAHVIWRTESLLADGFSRPDIYYVYWSSNARLKRPLDPIFDPSSGGGWISCGGVTRKKSPRSVRDWFGFVYTDCVPGWE